MHSQPHVGLARSSDLCIVGAQAVALGFGGQPRSIELGG